jgi:hypothetical protein
VGDSQENNDFVTNGFIGKSTQAYKRLYRMVAEVLDRGEQVFIEYKHINDFFKG